VLLSSDVFLPVPSSFVAVISGQALGTIGGGLLNWTSICLGHLIGFIVARRFGRPFVERFIGRGGMDQASLAWRLGAVPGLIISRPVPVLAEALSMFAGLGGVSTKHYLMIVSLANVPHSFIYSWAGARMHEAGSLGAVIAAGVGLPTAGYLIFVFWKIRSHAKSI
jgi:uncharacterized membrane protein YdjX (TVP38/TMEM64 family)